VCWLPEGGERPGVARQRHRERDGDEEGQRRERRNGHGSRRGEKRPREQSRAKRRGVGRLAGGSWRGGSRYVGWLDGTATSGFAGLREDRRGKWEEGNRQGIAGGVRAGGDRASEGRERGMGLVRRTSQRATWRRAEGWAREGGRGRRRDAKGGWERVGREAGSGRAEEAAMTTRGAGLSL
jgi:hypothetical protein